LEISSPVLSFFRRKKEQIVDCSFFSEKKRKGNRRKKESRKKKGRKGKKEAPVPSKKTSFFWTSKILDRSLGLGTEGSVSRFCKELAAPIPTYGWEKEEEL
jgi:hypothetical protein